MDIALANQRRITQASKYYSYSESLSSTLESRPLSFRSTFAFPSNPVHTILSNYYYNIDCPVRSLIEKPNRCFFALFFFSCSCSKTAAFFPLLSNKWTNHNDFASSHKKLCFIKHFFWYINVKVCTQNSLKRRETCVLDF